MFLSGQKLPLLVALLLVVSTVLFAVGTAIDHGQRGEHADENALVSQGENGAEPSEANEAGEATGEASGSHADEETAEEGQHSEEIAGIDPESWPLVVLVIAVSFALAAGVYWRRGRWLIAALVFGILFAAADTRELVHQLDESQTTVAAIAGVLIGLHLLVALRDRAHAREEEGLAADDLAAARQQSRS